MIHRTIAVLMLVATTSLSACSDATTSTAPAAPPLDGEMIFRGLLFGEEPVAQMLPEVWKGVQTENPEWTAEQRYGVAETKNQLIGDIRAMDAAFFERFRAAMTSGEHLRVQRALEESSSMLKEAIKGRTLEIEDAPDGTGYCGVINLAWNVNLAVNVNGAVNVNAAVNLNIFTNVNIATNVNFWFSDVERVDEASALMQDQLVQAVSVRLRGR